MSDCAPSHRDLLDMTLTPIRPRPAPHLQSLDVDAVRAGGGGGRVVVPVVRRAVGGDEQPALGSGRQRQRWRRLCSLLLGEVVREGDDDLVLRPDALLVHGDALLEARRLLLQTPEGAPTGIGRGRDGQADGHGDALLEARRLLLQTPEGVLR